VCSLDRDELLAWLSDEDVKVTACELCQPNDDSSGTELSDLTKLAREILDYLVESAVLHLDWPEGPAYRVTMSDVAHAMGKSLAQISSAVNQLIDHHMIVVHRSALSHSFASHHQVIATAAAIKRLPTFEVDSEAELQERLNAMHEEA
jgi:hypothetical protein